MLSYETCKKLKETGFPQTTLFTVIKFGQSYSRPSFEEIWAKLPATSGSDWGGFGDLTLNKDEIYYLRFEETVSIKNKDNIEVDLYKNIENNNITEAAADLWLLLKEQGLI